MRLRVGQPVRSTALTVRRPPFVLARFSRSVSPAAAQQEADGNGRVARDSGEPGGGGIMRLTLAVDEGSLGPSPLGEGEPFPPDDRVVTAPRRTIEAIYRAQAPRLLRFFARRSGSAEAEDLVNESFARLAAAPAVRCGDVDNVDAYLQQVASNALRNRARAAFHRSIVDLDIQTAPDKVDPVALLEARDTLARLQLALDKLPPKTRAIFMAHRLDGATYAELAETHGLSVKGVEWHMSKAIAHVHRVAGRR